MVRKEHKLIQSYVLEKYFVSTAYRKCSAALAPDLWYYETMVWEWDKTKKKVGHIIETKDSGSNAGCAIENHNEICEELLIKELSNGKE